MKFLIQFVVTRGNDRPGVVEETITDARELADAHVTAFTLFEAVCKNHPQTLPNGYQIRDDKGHVVLRSWEPRHG